MRLSSLVVAVVLLVSPAVFAQHSSAGGSSSAGSSGGSSGAASHAGPRVDRVRGVPRTRQAAPLLRAVTVPAGQPRTAPALAAPARDHQHRTPARNLPAPIMQARSVNRTMRACKAARPRNLARTRSRSIKVLSPSCVTRSGSTSQRPLKQTCDGRSARRSLAESPNRNLQRQ